MNLKPAPLTFTIYQGSALSMPLSWQTGDPLEPVDLTGYTALMQIRSKRDLNGDLYMTLSSEDGTILFDADRTLGKFALNLSMSQTSALSFDRGFADLIMIPPSEIGVRLIEFTINLNKGTTKPGGRA